MKRVGVGLAVGLVALAVVRLFVGAAWGAFSFLVFVFSAIAVFDVLTSRRPAGQKAIWVVFILLAPLLGALVYWIGANGDVA